MGKFISKNRIFDLIHAVYSVHGFTSYEDYVGLLKDVETSTNADVQVVKHGKWMSKCEGDIYEFSECSECGNTESCETPYCAQCGARMDKS